MNGYSCPCCGEFIPSTSLTRMCDCPSCKASVDEQRREKHVHQLIEQADRIAKAMGARFIRTTQDGER